MHSECPRLAQLVVHVAVSLGVHSKYEDCGDVVNYEADSTEPRVQKIPEMVCKCLASGKLMVEGGEQAKYSLECRADVPSRLGML